VKYGRQFNPVHDDTNPTTTEQEYVDSIRYDVRCLGADWEGARFYATPATTSTSSTKWAEKLIQERQGVCR